MSHCFNLYLPFGTFAVNDLFLSTLKTSVREMVGRRKKTKSVSDRIWFIFLLWLSSPNNFCLKPGLFIFYKCGIIFLVKLQFCKYLQFYEIFLYEIWKLLVCLLYYCLQMLSIWSAFYGWVDKRISLFDDTFGYTSSSIWKSFLNRRCEIFWCGWLITYMK